MPAQEVTKFAAYMWYLGSNRKNAIKSLKQSYILSGFRLNLIKNVIRIGVLHENEHILIIH